MGAALFNALGSLGSQWGEAKSQLGEEQLRTKMLAAQMSRQDAMQQLEQQRLAGEKERIGFERERAVQAIAKEKATQEQHYQEGWEQGKAMVFENPQDPKTLIVRNMRAQPGQESTRIVPRGQGYMTFEEQERIKKPEKESAPEANWDQAMTIAKQMYPKLSGPELVKKAMEIYKPAGAKIMFGLGGAGGGGDMSKIYADMIAHGEPLTSIPMKDRARAWKAAKDSGQPMPYKLTPAAQKVIEETVPIRNAVEDIMGVLEPLKNDNTVGKFAKERLKYMVGMASPDVKVIGDATKLISATELTRLMAAARIMRSSSRTLQMLNKALVHVPNMWSDSPMKQYGQWQVVLDSLDELDKDAFNLGQAGGIYPGSIPGLGGPTTPTPGNLPTAPPATPGADSDPLNMYGGGRPR